MQTNRKGPASRRPEWSGDEMEGRRCRPPLKEKKCCEIKWFEIIKLGNLCPRCRSGTIRSKYSSSPFFKLDWFLKEVIYYFYMILMSLRIFSEQINIESLALDGDPLKMPNALCLLLLLRQLNFIGSKYLHVPYVAHFIINIH